jgi:hypothetical protein
MLAIFARFMAFVTICQPMPVFYDGERNYTHRFMPAIAYL